MKDLIIVTGLPRSGTSLLMAMLQAGGVPLLTDERRPPDEHNPRGYFEHSRVLQLASDSSWLRAAAGQAVKILSRQLEFVPADVPVRVLVTERDLQEVVSSQERMLGADSQPQDWLELFRKESQRFKGWLARQSWPFLLVRHQKLLHEPQTTAAEIQQFLGRELDLAAMVAQVDARLYRSRPC